MAATTTRLRDYGHIIYSAPPFPSDTVKRKLNVVASVTAGIAASAFALFGRLIVAADFGVVMDLSEDIVHAVTIMALLQSGAATPNPRERWP